MKIIYFLGVVSLFYSCNLYTELADMRYNHDYKSKIYESNMFDSLYSYYDVTDFILENIEYSENTMFDSNEVKDILDKGKGKCDDMCLVYCNILYVVRGLKFNLVAVRHDSARAIVEGGVANHMVVQSPSGLLIDPQSGEICDYDIKYIYYFDDVFTVDK